MHLHFHQHQSAKNFRTRYFVLRGLGKQTGLGLFFTREVLAITGLSITETGTPGKGARFEIAVPKGEYRIADTQLSA